MSQNEPFPPPGTQDKTIARSLGEFFGHIWRGVKTDPKQLAKSGDATRVKTREHHEEEVRETPQGKMTIRRTIIEEVDLPPNRPAE
jgi:hypothetical protein